jgi:hypothetical protein
LQFLAVDPYDSLRKRAGLRIVRKTYAARLAVVVRGICCVEGDWRTDAEKMTT